MEKERKGSRKQERSLASLLDPLLFEFHYHFFSLFTSSSMISIRMFLQAMSTATPVRHLSLEIFRRKLSLLLWSRQFGNRSFPVEIKRSTSDRGVSQWPREHEWSLALNLDVILKIFVASGSRRSPVLLQREQGRRQRSNPCLS